LNSPKELTSNGQFIGMDEAGYGPNLGPLVIATSVWSLPHDPRDFDFYKTMSAAVSPKSHARWTRLHIADSKEVYSVASGLASLESSALTLLQACGITCKSFKVLWHELSGIEMDESVPWFDNADLQLPVAADPDHIDQLSTILNKELSLADVKCERIAAQIVTAKRFNEHLDQHGSKGILLSTLAFELLARVWSRTDNTNTMFVGDKHGGRNRYDELLADILDGEMIFRLEEGRAVSRYKINNTELRFQTKGEEHFPVAVASIIAKYVRELSMILFNRYWEQHAPGIKPTKGYPLDAKRFRTAVDSLRPELGIDDHIFWRMK